MPQVGQGNRLDQRQTARLHQLALLHPPLDHQEVLGQVVLGQPGIHRPGQADDAHRRVRRDPRAPQRGESQLRNRAGHALAGASAHVRRPLREDVHPAPGTHDQVPDAH